MYKITLFKKIKSKKCKYIRNVVTECIKKITVNFLIIKILIILVQEILFWQK